MVAARRCSVDFGNIRHIPSREFGFGRIRLRFSRHLPRMEASNWLLPPRSWLPNLATAANISVGFAAILMAADGQFELAVHLLLLGIFLDMIDGRLARWLKATSALGQQLDSFCDMVTFGIAPAFLLYRAVLYRAGAVGFAVALFYLLSGVFRLARFNLLTDAHGKEKRTLGVPIPIAASYLMAAVLLRDTLPAWATAVVALVVSLAMASRWRLPDLAGKGLLSALLLIGLINYLWFIAQPNWYTVVWWNVWNGVILLAAKREDRVLAPPRPAAEL